MVLADLGARVVKVERRGSGDDARGFGPFCGDRSVYFESLNRGKASVALDLADPADREQFEALVEEADVLVENFRPGTLERMGYGWDVLHARWPRLVYAAVSGFGRTGPYSERPAYDMVVQAMGGLMSLTGHPGGPPTRVGTSVGDIAAGMFAVIGILSALHDRERTGLGQIVDIAMLDCQVAILENAIARYSATGLIPGTAGQPPPFDHPLRRVPGGRHPSGDRGGQRPAVLQAVRDAGASGARGRSPLRHQRRQDPPRRLAGRRGGRSPLGRFRGRLAGAAAGGGNTVRADQRHRGGGDGCGGESPEHDRGGGPTGRLDPRDSGEPRQAVPPRRPPEPSTGARTGLIVASYRLAVIRLAVGGWRLAMVRCRLSG